MIAILSTKGYTRPVKIPFMKFRCLHDFRLCALAALVLGTAARGEDILLPIAEHRELELSCASEPGHTYQIQFSDNLIDWDFLNENRQFGGDGYQETHVPIAGSGKFFRYFIAAEPPGGLAPWSVTLRNWVLNVQGHPQILHFTSATTGTLSAGNTSSPPVTFAYSVLRTGENLLRVQLDLPEGVHRTLEMNFLSLSQGEFTSTDVADGIALESDSGVFADSPPLASPPLAPELLQQKAAVLKGTASTSYYKLAALPPPTTSTYNRTEPTKADLTLQTGNRTELYQLTFVSAQTGTYTLVRTQPSVPEFRDTGVFALADAP